MSSRESAEQYHLRINRVINYIKSHLDENPSLDKLSGVANFSKYHFHRIFRSQVGETLNDFIRRLRLEKAVQLLIYDRKQDITSIAQSCGFSSSANFAKAFKSHFGESPSAIRKQLDFREPEELFSKIGKLKRNNGKALPVQTLQNDQTLESTMQRRNTMELAEKRQIMNVDVQDLPARHVAYIRKIGPYTMEEIGPVYDRLFAWAGANDLMNAQTLCLGLSWSDPNITPDDKLQFDACITVPEATPVSGEISTQTVPGGKNAVYHCEVEDDDFHGAWMDLMRDWLPTSGYQPDDRPCIEVYYNEAKDHPENKWILDICLPVKPL